MRSTILTILSLSLNAVASGCSDSPTSSLPPGSGSSGGNAVVTESSCPEGIPFKNVSGKVVIDVQLNGVAETMFLDTGAPRSAFDTSLQGALGQGVTINAGGITDSIFRPDFEDMAKFQLPKGVHGILGTDFVGKRIVHIDYPRSRWWIATEPNEKALLACEHLVRTPHVEKIFRDNYLYVHGELEGLPGWLLIDSGASLGGIPVSAFNEMVKANPRNYLSGFYTPSGIGTFWANLVPVANVSFGGASVVNLLARTIPDDMIIFSRFPDNGRSLGLLPSDFLSQYLVSIDLKELTLRLDRGVNAPLSGRWKYYATGLSLEEKLSGEPIHVAGVLPGSSAADQGLQVGDEILTLEAQPISNIDTYTRSWMLVSKDPKATLKVAFRHDTTDRVVTLAMRDLLIAPTLK